MNEVKKAGPIYGVELIDSLPLDGGSMTQAMPSRRDLDDVLKRSQRTVAGYEVLLEHYRRAMARLTSIAAYCDSNVDDCDPYCCAEYLREVKELATEPAQGVDDVTM
jgi:hypothetical protein